MVTATTKDDRCLTDAARYKLPGQSKATGWYPQQAVCCSATKISDAPSCEKNIQDLKIASQSKVWFDLDKTSREHSFHPPAA
jgi:hypothetical protein